MTSFQVYIPKHYETASYCCYLFCITVVPCYIALPLSRLCCFADFFTVLFFTVNSDWLRGVTVVIKLLSLQ